MPANNHPADQAAIEALHSLHSEHIADRLIALQDDAYAMGRARGLQDGPAWINVRDRLPSVKESDEQEVIVCVRRAHNGQSYVFAARYLNQFALYTEGHPDADENGCLISTGWHDVKEHSEYDGWYSPLITVEGDEVTHWMPLPAAPGASA